jgi:hypothetical protein
MLSFCLGVTQRSNSLPTGSVAPPISVRLFASAALGGLTGRGERGQIFAFSSRFVRHSPRSALDEHADSNPLPHREQKKNKRADPRIVYERPTPRCSIDRDGKMSHRYGQDESGQIRDFADFDPKLFATVPFAPGIQGAARDEHEWVGTRLEKVAKVSTHALALFEIADRWLAKENESAAHGKMQHEQNRDDGVAAKNAHGVISSG